MRTKITHLTTNKPINPQSYRFISNQHEGHNINHVCEQAVICAVLHLSECVPLAQQLALLALPALHEQLTHIQQWGTRDDVCLCAHAQGGVGFPRGTKQHIAVIGACSLLLFCIGVVIVVINHLPSKHGYYPRCPRTPNLTVAHMATMIASSTSHSPMDSPILVPSDLALCGGCMTRSGSGCSG